MKLFLSPNEIEKYVPIRNREFKPLDFHKNSNSLGEGGKNEEGKNNHFRFL